jgi:DNA or RNA helicases of superfamily II
MLRDYQIEMKTRLMEAWKAHRSVMVQMPTGTGKTHLLASVVSEFVSSAGSGVWLIAHRRELVRKWRKRWLNMVSGGRILRSG